jgi:hypothetical protein
MDHETPEIQENGKKRNERSASGDLRSIVDPTKTGRVQKE